MSDTQNVLLRQFDENRAEFGLTNLFCHLTYELLADEKEEENLF
jgi:hypothetical protein